MTDAPGIIRTMTIDEFIRHYEHEGPFELVDGEIVPMSPVVMRHTTIGKRLMKALLPFEEAGLGEVFSEAPFILSYSADWVKGSRVPDLMFIRADKLRAYRAQDPDWEDKPLVLVPDLAIEIVSPSDHYSEIETKVTRYLRDGVGRVWVFDPQPKTVIIHQSGELPVTLTVSDTLTAGDLIPGLELPLAAIFGS